MSNHSKITEHEVIVGNIGSVYCGEDEAEAKRTFDSYVTDSKANYGRAAGEDVTMMTAGEPVAEYFGTLGAQESEDLMESVDGVRLKN